MIKNKKRMDETVTITDGDEVREVKIYVEKPSNAILKQADRYKSRAWNEAVQDDVLTKKELAVLMKTRGIWDEEREKKEKALTKEIIALEKELYHGKPGHRKPKLSEGRALAIQVRQKRNALRELIAEKIALEENTADSIADNVKFDFIVASCTFYEDGKPVYKDFDDYNNKSVDIVAFTAASMLGRMLYNLDSEYEKNLPENEFLRKYNLVDEDLNLIDPNSPTHLIDTEGKRIDKDGYYLNDQGHRIDKDGNVLTEDGKYVMTDYENDLMITPPSPLVQDKPKKPTKKEESETSNMES